MKKQKYQQQHSRRNQFHIDFDLDGACGDIYSTESYFLAKKVYTDKFESVDKNGNTFTAEHIRLKCVPTSCVKYISKSMNINPMDIYKHIYSQGNHVKFDLTEEGKKLRV